MSQDFKPRWQRYVDASWQQEGKRREPVSEAAIADLRKRAAAASLVLDEGYVGFLRYANGAAFFPGASANPQGPLDDFVLYNEGLRWIDGTVYGNFDDEYIVLGLDGKFRRLGGADPGYALGEWATFAEVLTEMLPYDLGVDTPV